MKIIVDTCIWSLALRRDHDRSDPLVIELEELIKDVRIQMIGPIRQEILTGIKLKRQFEDLKKYLSAFPDLPLQSPDFELAAEYFNINRRKGIQGSNTDFLICALSYRHQMPIFTIDDDFKLYMANIPIILYSPRSRS
jgi:predicted nucleic acid-binding protein